MVPCLQPMAHLLTFPTTPMFTLPTHLHLLFLHLQLMQFLLTLLQAWVCHQPATHLQLFPLEGSRLSPHPSLHLACRLSGD